MNINKTESIWEKFKISTVHFVYLFSFIFLYKEQITDECLAQLEKNWYILW